MAVSRKCYCNECRVSRTIYRVFFLVAAVVLFWFLLTRLN